MTITEPASAEPTTAEANPNASTGIMVALLPQDTEPLLAVAPQGETTFDAESLHLTLGYFGSVEDDGAPTVDDLVAAIYDVFEDLETITTQATHVSALGPEGESAVVEVPDPTIHNVRATIIDAIEAQGITADSTYAFRPHITLGEFLCDEGPLDAAVDVTFDRVRITAGPDVRDLTIGTPIIQQSSFIASMEYDGTTIRISTIHGDTITIPMTAELNDLDFDAPLGAPNLPPREWFTEIPEQLLLNQVDGDITVAMTGDELGRAFALYYDHDVCYMNEPGECWQPPASPTGNEAFVVGSIPYSQFGQGEDLHVGAIPIAGGHTSTAIDEFEDAKAARNDTPENQRLVGTLFDVMLPRQFDEVDGELVPNMEAGVRQVGLFLGAAVPEMTVAEALMVNRSGLSGEWWPREGFTDIEGNYHAELVLDALGPVLVTKAAIPTNRGGQANANVELTYARAASGAWRGPTIRTTTRIGEPEMNVKDITVDPKTACAQCAIKRAATNKTAACCTACGDAEAEAEKIAKAQAEDAEATSASTDAKVAEGDSSLPSGGGPTDEMDNDSGDVAAQLGEAMERIGQLEAVVMQHEQLLAQINASGVDAEEATTATRLAARKATPKRRVAQLPEGLTYEQLRNEISSAVRSLEGEGEWVWLLDFDDESATYEFESSEGITTYQQAWSYDGANVSLTGDRTEVVLTYTPAPGGTPAVDSTGDDGAPAVDAPAAPAPA